VYKGVGEINIPKLFKGMQQEEEFVELARILADNHRPVSEIRRDEEHYFRYSDLEKEAIGMAMD
jgi:hypothetical protein